MTSTIHRRLYQRASVAERRGAAYLYWIGPVKRGPINCTTGYVACVFGFQSRWHAYASAMPHLVMTTPLGTFRGLAAAEKATKTKMRWLDKVEKALSGNAKRRKGCS